MRVISITITVNRDEVSPEVVKSRLEKHFPNYLDKPEVRYPNRTDAINLHWKKISIGTNLDMNQKGRDIAHTFPDSSIQIEEVNEQSLRNRYMPTIYGLAYSTAMAVIIYFFTLKDL